jgi:Tol biopolymer transport system component
MVTISDIAYLTSGPQRNFALRLSRLQVNENNPSIAQSGESVSRLTSGAPADDSKSVCRTSLLSDEPETIDAFSSHDRIAETIASLIRPKDAKGISIGLEGSWGSGKSTVAKILARKLGNEKNIALITFDAWAHEGDPLRRTFLETIIRRLQELEGNWIDKKQWSDRVEELANRREVVNTTDTLTITGWGKLVAFTLLLVPIGGAFIAAALREDITLYPGPLARKFLVLFVLGLALTFTPFLIFLSSLIWRGRRKNNDGDGQAKPDERPNTRLDKQSDLLSLLFNRGPTEKTTITSKTVNPTSIEFEQNFSSLIGQALKDGQKRIVLILDNLDRVDAKDALIIWSTLQTFLQHKDTGRPTWRDRLWILVLYDLKGLSLLWQETTNEPHHGRTAASFIDKSFQIRFEVPALVLSDWGKFLITKLKEAFPDHDDSDLHAVYRVMAIGLAKDNRHPTIRELKLYVNQIGSIHRQWAGDASDSDTFPLAHIAYYVLTRRDGKEIVEELLAATEPAFPPTEYQDLLGSMVRENLAAISFNVEVNVAQQLLLTDRIKNALTLGSAEELKNTASLLQRGFWEIFEQVVTTEWAGGELVRIADAALALEESGLLGSALQPTARSVTRKMCDLASTVSAWSPLDENKAKGLATLLRWKNSLQASSAQLENYRTILIKSVSLGLKEQAMRADLTFNAREWLDCLWIISRDLQPFERISGNQTVTDTLSEQLRLENPLESSELEAILEVLSLFRADPDASVRTEEVLKDLVETDHIRRQLQGGTSKTSNSVAWSLYLLLSYGSGFEPSSLAGATGEGTKKILDSLFTDPAGAVVQKFVEILGQFEQLPMLFKLTKADVKPFVVSTLRIALNRPDARNLFSGADSVPHLEFVFREIGNSEEEVATLTKLIADISISTKLVDELIARDFNPLDARLYLLLLTTTDGDNTAFVSWCVEGLRAVDSKLWEVQLVFGGPLLDLAFYLKSSGAEVELGQEYFTALTKFAEDSEALFEGIPSKFGSNFADLLGPIESKFRYAFQDQLYNLVRKPFGKLPSWFFNIFGTELTAQLLYSSRGARVLDLFNYILEADKAGLEWISNAVTQSEVVLTTKYSNEPGWTKFRANIREQLITGDKGSGLIGDENPNREGLSLIRNIAGALNIAVVRNGLISFASYSEEDWNISVMSPDGSNKTELTSNIGELNDQLSSQDKHPAWSPDGRRIAYTSTHLNKSDIFIMDANGDNRIQLTSAPKGSHRPAWAPDGQELVLLRGSGKQADIYVIDITSKKEKTLTLDSTQNGHPNWSPDGSRITFHRIGQEIWPDKRIFVMNADGSESESITNGPTDVDPSWSPDGTQIVFARRRKDQAGGIYVMDPSGRDPFQLTEEKDPYAPAWSPDGTKILFQVSSGVEGMIYQIDKDGQNRKQLTAGIDPSWQPVVKEEPVTDDAAPLPT